MTTAKDVSSRFQNQVDSIFEFAKNHPTQRTAEANGTVWGAYNAISGYFSHVKDFKNASDRMGSILYGTGDLAIKKAFQYASALI
jgi:hypothetical protein